jgi:hypothetical protein
MSSKFFIDTAAAVSAHEMLRTSSFIERYMIGSEIWVGILLYACLFHSEIIFCFPLQATVFEISTLMQIDN